MLLTRQRIKISQPFDAPPVLAFPWIQHSHLNLDTQNTLPQEDVPDGVVDKVVGGLTRVDHETVGELHGLGTSGTQFTGYDDFTTLGAGVHDESEDTVTGSE